MSFYTWSVDGGLKKWFIPKQEPRGEESIQNLTYENWQFIMKSLQTHLSQIANGAHESKIYFTVQLGVNLVASMDSEIIWLLSCTLKCFEMFWWTDFSHQGAKIVGYEGVHIE